jgi:Family of unknown function (DUF6427)
VLSLFRTNNQINNIFLILPLIVLNLNIFNNPVQNIMSDNSLIGMTLIEQLKNLKYFYSFNFLIVFVSAIILNVMLSKNKIVEQNNLFPGFVYVLFTSLFNNFLQFNFIILSNLFVIIGMYYLGNFKNSKVSIHLSIFNSGFFFALSALFYKPYILYILLGFLGLIIFNNLSIKKILEILLSYILPIFCAFSLFYFFQKTALFNNNFIFDKIGFHFMDKTEAIKYATIGIFLVFVLLFYFNFISRKLFAVQKNIKFFYWVLIISILTILLITNHLNSTNLLAVILPLSILFSNFYSSINKGYAEVLNIAIIGLIVYNHYYLGL